MPSGRALQGSLTSTTSSACHAPDLLWPGSRPPRNEREESKTRDRTFTSGTMSQGDPTAGGWRWYGLFYLKILDLYLFSGLFLYFNYFIDLSFGFFIFLIYIYI